MFSSSLVYMAGLIQENPKHFCCNSSSSNFFYSASDVILKKHHSYAVRKKNTVLGAAERAFRHRSPG
jgi:hypothetical protein